MLNRRTLLASALLSSQAKSAIRFSEPPLVIPNVMGNISPLDWEIELFDDFTSFVASSTSETAITDATSLWHTTFAPGVHHISGPIEQQHYCNPYHTPGINPFSHSGSILTIAASVPTPDQLALIRSLDGYTPFISGALNTSRIFPNGMDCGYFELNCKLPRGVGMWTAFWLNDDCVNMDEPTASLQFDPIIHVHVGEIDKNIGMDLMQDFHTYGCLWTPAYVATYFDGRRLNSSNTGIRSGLNFSIGTGMDVASTTRVQLPASFDIDWIRYSRLANVAIAR